MENNFIFQKFTLATRHPWHQSDGLVPGQIAKTSDSARGARVPGYFLVKLNSQHFPKEHYVSSTHIPYFGKSFANVHGVNIHVNIQVLECLCCSNLISPKGAMMDEKISYVRKSSTVRKNEIEKALAIRQAVDLKPRATATAISRLVGVSDSNLLRTRLWEMVDEGRLIADPQDFYRGKIKTKWLFQVPADRLPDVLGDAYEVQT